MLLTFDKIPKSSLVALVKLQNFDHLIKDVYYFYMHK